MSLNLHGPVEGVQEDLGEGDDLRRAVPAVRAVHQHRSALPLHRRAHQSGCLQHDGQVLQPTGTLQGREPAKKWKMEMDTFWTWPVKRTLLLLNNFAT